MKTIDTEKGRNDLAKLFKGTGAEVGVERAVFSKYICEKNPETTLIGIDPLLAYKGYREHVSQEKLDGFFDEVLERMKDKKFMFIRKTSLEATEDIGDESLDFVYIDANHSHEHSFADISAWHKKVRPGGIVSGHDYVRKKGLDHMFGVKDALRDFCDKNNITEVTIWRGDRSPSWSYIK